MQFAVEEVERITKHLQDAESSQIFANRLLYSMTSHKSYIRNIISTTFEGQIFEKELNEHKNEKLILFGAGQWGKWIKKYYDDFNWCYFVDNFSNGSLFDDIPIISTAELDEKYKNSFIVISSKYFWKEIEKQLIEMGIEKDRIFPLGKLIEEIERKIYFDLPFLKRESNEIFIDAGGYDGKTTEEFFKWLGNKEGKAYIFEPDLESEEKCKALFYKNANVNVISKGLWKSDGIVQFVTNGTESRIVNDDLLLLGDISIPVVSLDEVMSNERVTFIKMDVEGAELQALKGAEKIIRKDTPKLAISVYHKPEDIIEIPKLLLEYNSEYKFWLRHYSLSWFDTILYAL